jgi:hypothetical protein
MQDALRDKVSKIRSRFVRLALLGVIAVVGSPAVAQIQCSDLSVSDLHGNNVPGQITGIATNISDHEMKLVHLVFNLYDSNGTVIGNATAGQSNLLPAGAGGLKHRRADGFHGSSWSAPTVRGEPKPRYPQTPTYHNVNSAACGTIFPQSSASPSGAPSARRPV